MLAIAYIWPKVESYGKVHATIKELWNFTPWAGPRPLQWGGRESNFGGFQEGACPSPGREISKFLYGGVDLTIWLDFGPNIDILLLS